MSNLAKNLRTLLNDFKLSENQLARNTGIPQQMINRILSGQNQNPKIATLLPIAKYFSLTISQLLGEEAFPNDLRLQENIENFIKVPILEWSDISNYIDGIAVVQNKKFTTADVNFTGKGFALIAKDDSMEPKFPKNCILIFDSGKPIANLDFILVSSNESYLFRQVFIKKSISHIKCLNMNNDNFSLRPIKDGEIVIAVLVQSKTNFH